MIQRLGQFVRKYAVSRIRAARWLHSRYARALEDEVARLRAENRALVNSILGVAGIPPMQLTTATRSASAMEVTGASLGPPGRRKTSPHDGAGATQRVNIAASENAAGTRQGSSIAAVRRTARRSWQQIGRALEIGDARTARLERESDTETFPTPRNVVRRSRSNG